MKESFMVRLTLLVTLALLGFMPIKANAQAVGGACTTGQSSGPLSDGSILKCPSGTWVAAGGATPVQNVVTASRASGTAYQNTTGRMLFVQVGKTNATGIISCQSDANTTPSQNVAQTGLAGTVNIATVTFFVLPGNYYSCTLGAINFWVEITMPY